MNEIPTNRERIRQAVLLLRPKQWIKNLFVLLPIFFGGVFGEDGTLLGGAIAFMSFSLAASSIYCLNDIIDVEADRRHKEKCRRPIASGAVTVTAGYVLMAVTLCLALCLALLLPERGTALATVIAAYYLMNVAYCLWLKRASIVDVCVLALGFVLRILAGSAATGVLASHWIVLMTFLLALLLAFAKRRDDVVRMMATGQEPRHNTHRYNLTFINQAVTVTAAVTLVCYIMYTISPEVRERAGSEHVYFTTVFVLLGLLRYMQLTAVDQRSGDPTGLFYTDRFLQIVVLLWILSFVFILYL